VERLEGADAMGKTTRPKQIRRSPGEEKFNGLGNEWVETPDMNLFEVVNLGPIYKFREEGCRHQQVSNLLSTQKSPRRGSRGC